VFTGLVREVGRVEAVERSGEGAEIVVAAELARELGPGDSIAVDGVCLTAVDTAPSRFRAQAMAETLRRSTLGELAAGARVNLEPALAVGDRLGGHIVQGHVDGVAEVVGLAAEGFARRVEVRPPARLLRYIVEKGSVALAGVSLTVAAVAESTFSVALIPETQERTTLGELAAGSRVNIEVDVLAKHVERLVREYVHNLPAAGAGEAGR
jgi:riboflavin synthase